MTKRMIDADALLEWVDVKKCRFDFSAFDVIEKINELATSAPEPQTQESIFDADGWCSDMIKAPINRNKKLLLINRLSGEVTLQHLVSLTNESVINFYSHWQPLPKTPKEALRNNLNEFIG